MCSTHTQTHRDTSKIQYLPLFLFLFCFFRFPFPTSWSCPLSFSSSPRDNYTSLPVTVPFFFPYMYLSLDPFTQLSIFIYRSSFSLTRPVLSLSLSLCISIYLSLPLNLNVSQLSPRTPIPHFASAVVLQLQPFNCRYIRELVLSCSQQSFTRFVSYVRLFFLRYLNHFTTCTFSATTRRGHSAKMSLPASPQTMPACHR